MSEGPGKDFPFGWAIGIALVAIIVALALFALDYEHKHRGFVLDLNGKNELYDVAVRLSEADDEILAVCSLIDPQTEQHVCQFDDYICKKIAFGDYPIPQMGDSDLVYPTLLAGTFEYNSEKFRNIRVEWLGGRICYSFTFDTSGRYEVTNNDSLRLFPQTAKLVRTWGDFIIINQHDLLKRYIESRRANGSTEP